MEIAAEIVDIEKTVDGTGVFNLMLGIVLALKRMFVSVLLSCKKPYWALESLSYERAKTVVLGKIVGLFRMKLNPQRGVFWRHLGDFLQVIEAGEK